MKSVFIKGENEIYEKKDAYFYSEMTKKEKEKALEDVENTSDFTLMEQMTDIIPFIKVKKGEKFFGKTTENGNVLLSKNFSWDKKQIKCKKDFYLFYVDNKGIENNLEERNYLKMIKFLNFAIDIFKKIDDFKIVKEYFSKNTFEPLIFDSFSSEKIISLIKKSRDKEYLLLELNLNLDLLRKEIKPKIANMEFKKITKDYDFSQLETYDKFISFNNIFGFVFRSGEYIVNNNLFDFYLNEEDKY